VYHYIYVLTYTQRDGHYQSHPKRRYVKALCGKTVDLLNVKNFGIYVHSNNCIFTGRIHGAVHEVFTNIRVLIKINKSNIHYKYYVFNYLLHAMIKNKLTCIACIVQYQTSFFILNSYINEMFIIRTC
jgi:hypothetical protein